MTADPCRLVLEFSRPGGTFAFRMERQLYARRLHDKTYQHAELSWDADLTAAIESLRATKRSPETIQRLAHTLRDFLDRLGWSKQDAELSKSLHEQQRIILSISSNAAELYALPWELLTVGQTMRHLGGQDSVLIRYEWPATQTRSEEAARRQEGGRILLAHSQAGGRVPADDQLSAIQEACGAADYPFDVERDVLPAASWSSLSAVLEQARKQQRPISVLHLLCHGGKVGDTFGLLLDPDEEGGEGGIDAARLATLLGKHADMVRLVVVAACDSGNIGPLGNHMGSVAQAIHREGIATVVASRYPLSKKGANAFSQVFYRELLVKPSSVEDAFIAGRQHLAALDTGRIDWASVQLYAREADGDDSRPIIIRPYQGLRSLGPAQNRFFFGRQREVDEIVCELGALVRDGKPRLLIVQGWSGTGKSSLVMAGAVPRLTQPRKDEAGAAGEPGWTPGYTFARMKPGRDPMTSLDLALDGQRHRPLLLVVDQFEEVFTHVDEPKRTQFASHLWRLACDPSSQVSLILTLRSDFIGRCGEILLDGDSKRMDAVANDERHSVRISQMSLEQLRDCIQGPAAKVGLRLDTALISSMLRDVGTRLGALPLIAHTLDLLWQRRQQGRLSMEAYQQIGTAVGALHQHADHLLDELSLIDELKDHAPAMAERLFVALVGQQSDLIAANRDTRRRLLVHEIKDSLCHGDAKRTHCFDQMLTRLETGRILVFEGEGIRQTVEIAHEELIRGWRRLEGWLVRHRDMLVRKQELNGRLREYREHGDLLNELQIAQTRAFQESYPDDFSAEAAAFLKKSQSRVAARRLAGRLTLAIAVATSVIVGWFAIDAKKAKESAMKQAHVARRNAQSAADASLIADAQVLAGRNDSAGAMQLLDAVAKPEENPNWLGLALKALANAPAAIFRGHSNSVTRAAMSPDGQWIATGSDDRSARVWSIQNPSRMYEMAQHTGPITSVAFSPDGQWIATGSNDRTARVWSTRNPNRTKLLTLPAPPKTAAPLSPSAIPRQVQFGPDRSLLAVWGSAEGGRAIVWRSLKSQSDLFPANPMELGSGQVAWAAFSEDEHHNAIVTASTDGRAEVWDARTLSRLAAVPGRRSQPLVGAALVWTESAKRIMTVSENDLVTVWDVQPDEPRKAPVAIGTFPTQADGASVTAWSLHANGTRAAVGYSDGSVRVWDEMLEELFELTPALQEGTYDTRRAHGAWVTSVVFGPDDKASVRLVTTSRDGIARLWSSQRRLSLLVEQAAMRHPSAVWAASFSRDGDRLVTACADKLARLWKIEPTTQGVSRVSFNRDLSWVLLTNEGSFVSADSGYGLVGAVRAWEKLDVDPKKRFYLRSSLDRPPSGALHAAALSDDGSTAVGVTRDGTVSIWSIARPDQPLLLPRETQRAPDSFGPLLEADGRRLLVIAKGGELRLYPTSAPAAPVRFTGHGGKIVTAAWSRDAKWILAGSDDGAAYLWRADAPERPRRRLQDDRDPEDKISAVSLSAPDGSRILTVSEAGIARLWSSDGAGPEEGACLADRNRARDCQGLRLRGAELSPDGQWVAGIAGAAERRALLWSVDDPANPHEFGGGGVFSIDWKPDSSQLLTGSLDRTARVWKVKGKLAELLTELDGYDSRVTVARFTPDGRGAIATTVSGEVRIWPLDVQLVRTRLRDAILECLPEEKLARYFEPLEGASLDAGALHASCERRIRARAATSQ